MNEVIQGRGGERIVPAEYPAGHVEGVNERLNAIANEPDTVGPTRYRIPVPWLWSIILVIAAYLITVAVLLFVETVNMAPVAPPAPTDVQLPTIGFER